MARTIAGPRGRAQGDAPRDRTWRAEAGDPRENSHMKTRTASLALLTAAMMLPSMANAALARDSASSLDLYDPSAPAEPMFTTIPPQPQTTPHAPGVQLPQWNGSFIDHIFKTVKFTMVGTNPQTSNATTNIAVLIIPIKLVFPKNNGNMTFDPLVDKAQDGNTVTVDTWESPLFNDVNFTQGGTNLGTTQYIDAFQRGNFWTYVAGNGGGYHVLLFPTFLAESTVVVTSAHGKIIPNPYHGNGKVAVLDNAWYNGVLQNLMKQYAQINPNVLPLFLTDNTFVLFKTGKCCIGGYHSTNGKQPGGQTYATSTYITEGGNFCQDVSCISHELGEWMDDPFADNNVNCTDNSLMEVGDPLVGHVYPYASNGNTYNLQSLVFIWYFGAAPQIPPPVNAWLSFQNDMNHVCPGQ
jgi:hypothetical protein